MLRTVIGILLGYAAVALTIMVSFTLLWLALGEGRAFHPGTTRVTPLWLLGAIPLNFLAAVLGGWVAAWIDRARPQVAVFGLMGVILLFGVAAAVSRTLALPADPVASPPAGLGPYEAATLAIQPLWVAWILPLVGIVGVWLGGSFRMLQASRRSAF